MTVVVWPQMPTTGWKIKKKRIKSSFWLIFHTTPTISVFIYRDSGGSIEYKSKQAFYSFFYLCLWQAPVVWLLIMTDFTLIVAKKGKIAPCSHSPRYKGLWFLESLQKWQKLLGLFHLNVHGWGVERSPIKKSWGEGVKMKKIGGLHEKKIIGGGGLKLWAFHPPPPPPPCTFKWNSPYKKVATLATTEISVTTTIKI